MQLVSFFAPGGAVRCGAIVDGEVVDLAAADPRLPSSMQIGRAHV